MLNFFRKRSIVTQNKQELSNLIKVPARIVRITNIQQPDFNYNQKYVGELVRLGFKPTDAVYEIAIEFSHGCIRNHWIKLNPDLSKLAEFYPDIKFLRDFVGKDISCEVVKNEFYSGPIHKVFPQD